MAERHLILSCEHAGNAVPDHWRGAFIGHEGLLATHRGYDIGILAFAERLASRFEASVHTCTITRLLVDANRSPHSRTLFSEFARALPPGERRLLLERYYFPYREGVTEQVAAALAGGAGVLHLSLHSFTPVFRGVVRNADAGLLFDPAAAAEAAFCRRWQNLLRACAGGWRVRRNYPYRGVADSLATWLRRHLDHGGRYLGIELEINQHWPEAGGATWERLQADLLATLSAMLS
jgi:predicted N-formylglutamate amidohydrolase